MVRDIMLNKDLYLSLPRPVLTSIIRVISNISRQFRLMIRNFFVISVYVHLFKTFQRVICVISGAIRHDGHLYILCRPPEHIRYTIPSMRVYEDTPPFDLIMLTTFEEVNHFRYFGFDAATGCFYILNSASSCIWKFTIEDHKLTKWLCNLVQPISLTVSTDGQWRNHTRAITGNARDEFIFARVATVLKMSRVWCAQALGQITFLCLNPQYKFSTEQDDLAGKWTLL